MTCEPAYPDRDPGPGEVPEGWRILVGSCGAAGAFATGHPLDTAPGGAALHGLAEYAAGDGDRFGGSTDDELTGIICALDRAEAAAAALKHAAVAALAGPGNWEEFTGTELSWALAGTRWAAENMLDLAQTLTTKLPATYAAFRTGVLRQSKVEIIARAVAALDPAEARAAEAKVLDRAGRLTPGGLRAAIPRHLPLDRPIRPPVHHRTHPPPDLRGAGDDAGVRGPACGGCGHVDRLIT